MKRKETIMARPIKETPILFGEEARRFEERMKNVKPLSKERIAEIRRDYEYMMSMFERKKKDGKRTEVAL